MIYKKTEYMDMNAILMRLGKKIGEQQCENIATIVKEISETTGQQGQFPPQLVTIGSAIESIYRYVYGLYELGKFDEALVLFKLLEWFELNPRHILGLATCQHRLEDCQRACTTYKLAGIVKLNDPLNYHYASDCYIKIKDLISTKKELEKTLSKRKKYIIIKQIHKIS